MHDIWESLNTFLLIMQAELETGFDGWKSRKVGVYPSLKKDFSWKSILSFLSSVLFPKNLGHSRAGYGQKCSIK